MIHREGHGDTGPPRAFFGFVDPGAVLECVWALGFPRGQGSGERWKGAGEGGPLCARTIWYAYRILCPV